MPCQSTALPSGCCSYGHAYDAFRTLVQEPEVILSQLAEQPSEEVKDALLKNIKRKMTPQPLKVRADVELTCFAYEGVLAIQDAMRAAQATSKEDLQVDMRVIAAPLYVMTTMTLDKRAGLDAVEAAIQACKEAIEAKKGRLVVKEAPRVVSAEEDRALAELEAGEDSEVRRCTGRFCQPRPLPPPPSSLLTPCLYH